MAIGHSVRWHVRVNRRLSIAFMLVGLVVLWSFVLVGCGAPPTEPVSDSRTAPVVIEQETDTQDGSVVENAAESSASEPPSGMDTIALAELPPEALETIILIAEDGPFPYDKDGSTFFNREGILPPQPEGYYREYTVETPGSADRGARRIVAGADGELYYTDDHYDSFAWIVIE